MNKLAETLKAKRELEAKFKCSKCGIKLKHQTTLHCNCGGHIQPIEGDTNETNG